MIDLGLRKWVYEFFLRLILSIKVGYKFFRLSFKEFRLLLGWLFLDGRL